MVVEVVDMINKNKNIFWIVFGRGGGGGGGGGDVKTQYYGSQRCYSNLYLEFSLKFWKLQKTGFTMKRLHFGRRYVK